MPRFVIALLIILTAALPVRAFESAPVVSKRATVTLVTDTDTIAPGTPFRAGLRLRLTEGWHTYWKNPGDAGVPPELVFDPPAGPIDWPAPRRIAEGEVMTYAYTGEVLLPVTIQPNGAQPTGEITLKLHANWLVCKDICVPEEGDFVVVLPAGTPTPYAQAALFAAHDAAVPRVSPWRASIAADGSLFMHAPDLGFGAIPAASFIPDTPGRIIDNAAQILSERAGGFVLTLALAKGFKLEDGLSGILSVQDRAGQRSDLLIRAEPGPAPPPATPLVRVLLFALLGGLILNLMPCVFPILAIKAISLTTSLARNEARGHALSYTAGVLVTFAGLGAALLVAREAGEAAGWGFQFQSPVFVIAMTWVLFVVGLNLSGVFDISGGFTGTGHVLANRGGHVGSFFTGLLAVLVATPCTAPFMGVAIAAGLAAPPPVTIVVFLALGLGLAAPYVLLAFVPGLGRCLPRPGAWMDTLKQVLAFPMYAGAVWLLWVVSRSAGSDGVLTAGAGAVLLGFAAWVLGKGKWGRLAATVAVLGCLGVLAALPPGAVAQSAVAGAAVAEAAVAEAGVEAYSAARLSELRAAGRPVFVNMTASWCVSCLINERVALRTDAVRQAFAAGNVVTMKGDWTRQDAAITAFLRQHNRDGVPLYLYYKPGGGEPVELPQFLTEGTILRVLSGG